MNQNQSPEPLEHPETRRYRLKAIRAAERDPLNPVDSEKNFQARIAHRFFDTFQATGDGPRYTMSRPLKSGRRSEHFTADVELRGCAVILRNIKSA